MATKGTKSTKRTIGSARLEIKKLVLCFLWFLLPLVLSAVSAGACSPSPLAPQCHFRLLASYAKGSEISCWPRGPHASSTLPEEYLPVLPNRPALLNNSDWSLGFPWNARDGTGSDSLPQTPPLAEGPFPPVATITTVSRSWCAPTPCIPFVRVPTVPISGSVGKPAPPPS